MIHDKVYKWFELYFPHYAGETVDMWFPNGKNSIRIRQTNKAEFIFTYNDINDWKFETLTSYIKNLERKRK